MYADVGVYYIYIYNALWKLFSVLEINASSSADRNLFLFYFELIPSFISHCLTIFFYKYMCE